jgi:hypothetical protein
LRVTHSATGCAGYPRICMGLVPRLIVCRRNAIGFFS